MKSFLKHEILSVAAIAFLGLSPLVHAQSETPLPTNSNSQQIEMDAPQASVQEINDRLVIKVGANEYIIEPSGDLRESFDAMSAEDKESFRKNRSVFIAQAAKALQVMKYGFGVGSVVKEKISFMFRDLRDERNLNKAETLSPGAKGDALAAIEREMEERALETEARLKVTFRERSGKVVESFLNALDRNLWTQALLFAHSNEFGIVASGGLELLGGIQNKRGWGGLFDVGLSIGYNRDTKAVAIQIFRDFERFKSTSMKAVFVAGLVGKAGMYIANQRTGEMTRDGSSFYPPMVPGYSSTTKSSFQTGMSSGLTWPPSPLGDMLTYTNSLDNKVLLRITLSPILKGFVRIETGLNHKSLLFFVAPVKIAIDQIKKIMGRQSAAQGAGMCGKVFAN